MPPGTPCACVAPILEEEFDEEELDPLMQFLRAFMSGLKGDEAAAQKTIDRIAAKHGKETLMDWLKRFEGLSPETAKTCNFEF
jgi:predicted Zn-dependent peptidase